MCKYCCTNILTVLPSDKLDTLHVQLRKLMIAGVEEMERSRTGILGAIKQIEANHTSSLAHHKLLALLDELAKKSEEVIRTQILKSLAYDGMTARQSRIPEAWENTFEWVFRDSNIRFKEWLETDSAKDVFWLSGKPGSGKSTLMNFLYNHKQTRESLRVWAGPDRQLVLGSHFFWALGGTEKQRSLEGLLRSLLHSALRKCPNLIPLVCPAHIQHTFNSGNRDPWTLTELREGLTKIIQLDKTTSTKDIAASTRFCFFIDGLDECTGQTDDLLELCKLTIRLAHVKICVASRSWPAFRDSFIGDGSQMLELHELTKGDIRNYAQSRLSDHSQVNEFKKEDSLAFVSLVDEIVRKAHGVFLWVYLVVRSLLDGLSNDDDLSRLEQRLKYLPDDLDEYYQHVMNRIDPIYRKETARILRMFLCAEQPIPLLCLPPALETSSYQTVDEEAARSAAWAIKSNGTIRKQLHARCRDFLQVEPDPIAKCIARYHHVHLDDLVHCQYRVDLLHLTVKDFLKTSAVTQQLTSWDSNLQEPRLLLCECYIYMLKILPQLVFERCGDWRCFDRAQDEHASRSFQGINTEFLKIEETCGKAPWAMIDDYQRLMFTRTNGHTIRILGTAPDALAWHRDGLLWALYCRLLLYVEEKIKQGQAWITEGNKDMLLYYSLMRIDAEEQPWTIDARLYIVRTLLDWGVNPNENIPEEGEGSSVWSGWLTCLHEFSLDHLDTHTGNDNADHQDREDLFVITNTLLEYGADPELIVAGRQSWRLEGGDYAITPIDVFRETFRSEQVEILIERIRKSRNTVGYLYPQI